MKTAKLGFQILCITAVIIVGTEQVNAQGFGSYGYGGFNTNNIFGSNGDPYNRSGDSYSRGETMQGGDVMDAMVISVREVTIEASATAQTAGAAAGGAIGGIGGANVGNNGPIQAIGGILGAVVGAVGGDYAGKKLSEMKGGEIVFVLKDGQKQVVTQADGMSFKPGQMVYVVRTQLGGYGKQNIRIVPNNEAN